MNLSRRINSFLFFFFLFILFYSDFFPCFTYSFSYSESSFPFTTAYVVLASFDSCFPNSIYAICSLFILEPEAFSLNRNWSLGRTRSEHPENQEEAFQVQTQSHTHLWKALHMDSQVYNHLLYSLCLWSTTRTALHMMLCEQLEIAQKPKGSG